MTDIEKRANSYIGHPFDVYKDSCITTARIGYKNGATDQQKIDIEKALLLYRDALHKIVAVLDPTINAPEEAYDRCVEDFRKAMEG